MKFTLEQEQVLEAVRNHRLTVVRAGPGAGKTAVFVEILNRELNAFARSGVGIAALSFTNAAREEIAERLGGTPSSPHFVGTLDAFLFRYVIRPFGAAEGLPRSGAQVIPAPQAEVYGGPQVWVGPGKRDWRGIFELSLKSGQEDDPEVIVGTRPMSGRTRSSAIQALRKNWRETGRLAHSHVSYLSSCLLRGKHQQTILDILAKRFPVILVDEFQDTGHFAGRALLSLLSHRGVRAAVVGDPDQAIYGFSGASGSIFDRAAMLPGARDLTLARSHRCAKKVSQVASALSRSQKGVLALEQASEGRAVLIVYDTPKPTLEDLLVLVPVDDEGATILSRKNAPLLALLGNGRSVQPSGSSFGGGMHKATECFAAGDGSGAYKVVSAILGKVVFGEEVVNASQLEQHGVERWAWKGLCHRLLMKGLGRAPEETWNDWLTRIRTWLGSELALLSVPVPKLGVKIPAFKKDGNEQRLIQLVPKSSGRLSMTIHAAKGREFRHVLLIVPKPHKRHYPCPSVEWWSKEASSEEKEVAFVACSRAKETLSIAVHRQTYDALKQTRPEFVALFEVFECGSSRNSMT